MPPLPISPPTSARAAAPKSASPPPGAAGDFAALLDQTSARTASAEGPKNRPAQPESRHHDAAASKDDNKATVAPDGQATPVAEPAQPQPAVEVKSTEGAQGQRQPAAGDLTATAADPAAVGATLAADQSAAAAVPIAAPAPGTMTPAASIPTGAAGTTTPAVATIAASAATQAAAAAPAAQPGSADAVGSGDAAATPAHGAPAGKLQIPAELLNAKGGQTKDSKQGDPSQRELPPAPTLPPTADAAAAPTPAASAVAPTPVADPGVASAPAPTATIQAQPAATPQTATAPPFAGGAPQLSRASVLQTAERVQELVRIATTRAGTARAVLQLRPAELGQVDVHLRTTRNGLVATIAAHEQVGHDALQQAGNELRRTLEDKGVQLHSLDLQLGAGQNGFTNQGDAREASSGRRGAGASHDLGSDDTPAEDDLTITHAPSTPAGALVDVQA